MRIIVFVLMMGITIPSFATSSFPVAQTELTHEKGKKRVSFTLRNKSLRSIPLIIPGVMKPNLSPVSKSGVELKVGKKIIYKHKGKRKVLFVVTEELDGQVVDVAKLVREMKRQARQEDQD